MGWEQVVDTMIDQRRRCRDCGRLFSGEVRKAPRSRRCTECQRTARRARQRAFYRQHNGHRLGTPPGRRAGQRQDRGDDSAALTEVSLTDRIASLNERTRQELEQAPRQLARTCEFCRLLAMELGLLASERCSLDREPDDSGGCDAWQPRYRVDGDE